MKTPTKNNATCRHCDTPLKYTFADLGNSPLANSYVPFEKAHLGEKNYPLHVFVCEKCLLVQLEEFESPEEIFTDYAYFSSYSTSWLDHCKQYVETITERLKLNNNSLVVEIASNDGYLLQYFKEKNIPVLGIEPAKNVAKVAQEKGIETLTEFFGANIATQVSEQKKKANLVLGNNVLAHVPDINDFVVGIKNLLDQDGVVTIEFPHLLNMFKLNQFDTIYHEHFSYLSLLAVQEIFRTKGLRIFDVQELSTHGGSLRIFGCHEDSRKWEQCSNVAKVLEDEKSYGLDKVETYTDYPEQVVKVKNELLKFLVECQEQDQSVVCYGAPAKGVTLLNYCGVGQEYLQYTVDKSPHKQGHYMPGVKIPIFSPGKIKETKPNKIIILPWNLKQEILSELAYTKEWGCEIYVPVPKLERL